jgi:hypothetical protein
MTTTGRHIYTLTDRMEALADFLRVLVRPLVRKNQATGALLIAVEY